VRIMTAAGSSVPKKNGRPASGEFTKLQENCRLNPPCLAGLKSRMTLCAP
jgi:hypothetical protein